jgi:hypothetical protein
MRIKLLINDLEIVLFFSSKAIIHSANLGLYLGTTLIMNDNHA